MGINEDLYRSGRRFLSNSLKANSVIFDNLGKLGSFGDVSFRVSSTDIISPDELNTSKGANYKKHNIIGAPAVSEFMNRKLRSVSFNIKLFYTVAEIEKTLAKLTRMAETGENYPLIIGGKPLAENNFVLLDIKEKRTRTDGYGTPLVVEVSVQFEEYIESISRGVLSSTTIDQSNTYIESEKVIRNINRDVITKIGGKLW